MCACPGKGSVTDVTDAPDHGPDAHDVVLLVVVMPRDAWQALGSLDAAAARQLYIELAQELAPGLCLLLCVRVRGRVCAHRERVLECLKAWVLDCEECVPRARVHAPAREDAQKVLLAVDGKAGVLSC